MPSLDILRKRLFFLVILIVAPLLLVVVFFLVSILGDLNLPKIEVSSLKINVGATLRASKPKFNGIPIGKNLVSRAKVFESSINASSFTTVQVRKLASKFGFSDEPRKSAGLLIWSTLNSSFIADMENKNILYSQDTSRLLVTKIENFPDKNKAIRTAKNVLKKLDTDERNLDFEASAIGYSLDLGVDGGAERKNQAKVMILDIPFRIEGLNVYDDKGQPLVFQIKINQKGEATGFKAPVHNFSWSQVDDYPLQNPADSIKDLENGQGAVVQLITITPGKKTQKNNKLKTISLTGAKLGYYPSSEAKNYLLPVYIFSGKAVLQSNETANIILYDIAVPNKFLQK